MVTRFYRKLKDVASFEGNYHLNVGFANLHVPFLIRLFGSKCREQHVFFFYLGNICSAFFNLIANFELRLFCSNITSQTKISI